MHLRRASIGGIAALALCSGAFGQAVLETEQLRLEIGGNGKLKSLAAKSSGEEYAWTAAPAPIAVVEREGKIFACSAVSLAADVLTLQFADAGATAKYKATKTPTYLAFELTALEGQPIDRIQLLQLRIKKLPQLGGWINVAYDDRFGICLCAGNVRTDAGMQTSGDYVELRASAERQVGIEGAVAILFGCPEPQRRFLEVMEIVERDFHLPAGAKHRRSPMQQYSYLMCPATPDNIDEYIALAKRGGFRMLLFSYTAFTHGAGHLVFNAKYPNGMADLKRVTDKIRKAGLAVGLHLHYTKALKTDAYVTPVPDDRLHQVRKFTLAAPVDEKADTISVRENPAGCTHDDSRRIIKIGKELVAYRDYTTTPPFQFTGCERGHLKTRAAVHASGTPLGLLNVDDWHIFIRFDQNTDIQDEVAERIGQIVAESGPYDMVYFDGAEDVHEPFWYHVVGAQDRVYRRFKVEPTICETATLSHFSWHMMSRSNAYDVPGQYAKNFIHEISCRTAPSRALDFTRIDFGWFQGFGRDTAPDVIEYAVSRGAAWDCPFSLQIDLKRLADNPRGQDCLDVIKIWEDARLSGKLTDAQRQMLRTGPPDTQFVNVWEARMLPAWSDRWKKPTFSGQEHHLFINERGDYEVVPIREVPDVAGGQVRAYLFERAATPETTYVLAWAVKADGKLQIDLPAEQVSAMRPFGTQIPVTAQEKKATVPVGGRDYLVLRGVKPEQTEDLLRKAQFQASAENKIR